jgi:hypothetical protein
VRRNLRASFLRLTSEAREQNNMAEARKKKPAAKVHGQKGKRSALATKGEGALSKRAISTRGVEAGPRARKH